MLNADLAAGREAGTISAGSVSHIRAALATVQAALGAAMAGPTPTATVTVSPPPRNATTPHAATAPRNATAPSRPQPLPHRKPGGRGHGRGHGGGTDG
jgi:hypothetical protein